MFQGFFIAVVLCAILYGVLFLGYPFQNEFQKMYLFFLFLPILIIGTTLGAIGKKIYTNRFKKLFLIGLVLIYLVAVVYASLSVFSDKADILVGGEKIIVVLKLATTGFFLFGFFTIPLLALGVFLIELWTHPRM
ncbi:MAG: hypothetical protein N3A69_07815 [Leptospiraceae bacterium]|nr:hypothetical protein [Leptospiraceae bacterium]